MLEEMIRQKRMTLNDVRDCDPGYSCGRWMLNPPLPKNWMNAQNILDVFLGKCDQPQRSNMHPFSSHETRDASFNALKQHTKDAQH